MDPLFERLQAALTGRFSLERELGRGGMGVVFLARDVALDRPVAIKLLPAELATRSDARERFLREARTAARLSHPNIVPIHLVEVRDDLVYFVMAFVDGETLGQRVTRQGPLAPAEAVRIIREVSWALGYAHGCGVVHRDVKPDNILLEKGSGRAMVTDFGIARVASLGTMSQVGEVLGTAQFMAPEQADPAATLDGRTDIYALGATAFYAITGRLPFEGTSALALLAMHLAEPAPPIASVRSGLPAKLAEAVDRCLAKEPASRFPSAEALAESLGELPQAKPVPNSVTAVRDAANGAFLPALFGGMAWMLGTVLFPEQAPALGWFALAMAALGLTQVLVAVRQAARDGLSHADVVDGMARVSPISERTVELTGRQMATLDRAMRRPLGRLLSGAAGGLYVWFAVGGLRQLFTTRPLGVVNWLAAAGSLLFAAFGAFLLAAALGVVPASRLFRLERMDERRARFIRLMWDNAPMRLFFRFAALGTGTAPALPAAAAAPTEVLLGKAADELFDALPREVRGRLGDLPGVIRALEGAARTLRERRDQLERTIADAGRPGGDPARHDAVIGELAAARDAAAERLRTAVTALENLRLDLLRLKAGVGQTSDLAAALDAARAVSADLGRVIEARAEADRALDG